MDPFDERFEKRKVGAMRYSVIILLSVICSNYVTAQEKKQRSLWEINLDLGLRPNNSGWFEQARWVHEYSPRIGIGRTLNELMSAHLYFEYHKYHSAKRWGDMSAMVFQEEYPRNDQALYASLVFQNWAVVGLGAVNESTEDMVYRKTGVAEPDTSLHVLNGSNTLSFILMLGFKYDFSLGGDFFVPVGVYFENFRVSNAILRLGFSKRF